MSLREELEDRADKLDAEMLMISGRLKEIEKESDEVHACLRAIDELEFEAEDALLDDQPDDIAALEPAPTLTTFGQHQEMLDAGFVPVGNPEDDGPIQWEPVDGYAPVQEPREETAPQHPDAPFWAKMFVRDPVDA